MRTKSKKSDLEGKKFLFFEVGLVFALCITLTAFEWNSTRDIKIISRNANLGEIPSEEILITRPDELVPPPPKLRIPEVIIIHDDIVDIPENTDIFIEPNDDILKDIKFLIEDEPDLDEPIPFFQIEKKPTFMGGDQNSFTIWVANNLRYPEEAARNGIQGRVYLKFMIDFDGTVKNVEFLSATDRLLMEEAKRVVSSSPAWSPGMQRGKPAQVTFTFPVTFKLQ